VLETLWLCYKDPCKSLMEETHLQKAHTTGVVECLPSMCEVLGSIPSNAKEKNEQT
jgi:hypothetical protein